MGGHIVLFRPRSPKLGIRSARAVSYHGGETPGSGAILRVHRAKPRQLPEFGKIDALARTSSQTKATADVW
jgi:hypothetical protein